MTSRSEGPAELTGNGRRSRSTATSEQVAAKPIPAIPARGTPDASTASRTASTTARQMSLDDCSTIAPGSRHVAMARLALAMSRPFPSNTPARALPVPTSTPIYASFMALAQLRSQRNSAFPSAVARRDRGQPGRSRRPASPDSSPKRRRAPAASQEIALTGPPPGARTRISAASASRQRSRSPSA